LSPVSPPLAPSASYSTLTPVRADSDAYSLSSVRTSSRPTGISLHPDLETPGFNISILESLSAILSDNQVQKIFVTGEIALSLHGQRASGVQINNTGKLEQVVANKALLNDSGNGIYTLTTEQLPPKGAIALKYKAANFDDPQSKVPILIRTMWKIEPGSVSLMVGYCLNPAFTLSRAISNIVLLVSLPTDPRILSCQSKPQGQFSKERGQLLWQISAIEESEQIVIAKFTTEGQARCPGTVEARWECVGVTATGIDVGGIAAKDPFADDEDLFFQANVLRKLISGKYYCQS
jgi:F-BAR domain only protein